MSRKGWERLRRGLGGLLIERGDGHTKFCLNPFPDPGLGGVAITKDTCVPTGVLTDGLPHASDAVVGILGSNNGEGKPGTSESCQQLVLLDQLLEFGGFSG